MFAYCGNNPNTFSDITGKRFVGLGAQLELDVGSYTVGIEVIVYCDDLVCGDEDLVVSVYAYDGASIDFTDLANNPDYIKTVEKLCAAVSTVAAKDDIYTKSGLVSLQDALFGDTNGSVSLVAVFGNDDFTSVDDYTGPFDTVSVSVRHFKVTYAESPSCTAVTVGYTTSSKLLSISYGQTKYQRLESIM